MGLFDFFKPKKQAEHLNFDISFSETIDYSDAPLLTDYITDDDNEGYSPERFTDEYITGTPYTLRQLLVLVWWLRVKKGRLRDANTPKHFIYEYALNVEKLTKQFIADGKLAVDENNRVRSTETGKVLAERFADLWDIHSNSYEKLDNVFANWNYNQYLIDRNQKDIKRYQEELAYHKAFSEWESKNNMDNKQTLKRIDAIIADIERLQHQNDALTD